jgi:hypothetical protein
MELSPWIDNNPQFTRGNTVLYCTVLYCTVLVWSGLVWSGLKCDQSRGKIDLYLDGYSSSLFTLMEESQAP